MGAAPPYATIDFVLDAASLVRLALLAALWSAALLVFVADTLAWYQIVLALWGGVAGLFIHGGKCVERTSWSLSTLRRSKAGLSWEASLPPPPHTPLTPPPLPHTRRASSQSFSLRSPPTRMSSPRSPREPTR